MKIFIYSVYTAKVCNLNYTQIRAILVRAKLEIQATCRSFSGMNLIVSQVLFPSQNFRRGGKRARSLRPAKSVEEMSATFRNLRVEVTKRRRTFQILAGRRRRRRRRRPSTKKLRRSLNYGATE